MNKVELIGRLTKDPDVKNSQNENATSVTRYTLAVDRRNRSKSQEEQTADFISIVAFGNSAEFASKYFKKGLKVAVTGHIQTGSYTNKDGVRVYTTDVVAEDQEFVESKGGSAEAEPMASIPDEEELPFK
jgi:single-strand DNA-binding protein